MFRRFITLLALFNAVSVPFLIVDRVESVEFYQRSCTFTCQTPQARTIRVADIIDTTYDVRPYMTILYRCDEGTGCCQKGKVCQVKHFENLEVRFPTFIDSKYVFVNYTITNHTECSCQNRKDDIKR